MTASHGAPAEGLTGDRFVVFLQNHDQVGNRASGERLNVLLGSEAKQRLAASLLLLSPYVPLLFMGEEYGEENPFPFFCSFQAPELIEAVSTSAASSNLPIPTTGRRCPTRLRKPRSLRPRLTWSWPEGTFRAGLSAVVSRPAGRSPTMAGPARFRDTGPPGSRSGAGRGLHARARSRRGEADRMRALFNLGEQPARSARTRPSRAARVLFSSESPRMRWIAPRGGMAAIAVALGMCRVFDLNSSVI